ncbi:hypothetical protein ACJJTC_001991 [Scirpophaga incertulas]
MKILLSPAFLPPYNDSKEKCTQKDNSEQISWLTKLAPVICNYLCLVIIGLLTWCLLWNLYGDDWAWNGQWFRLLVVAVAAWTFGQVFEAVTTLPPFLGALLTGIFIRNIGFLDMNQYTQLDTSLRKIYPVIILGKASLGWNLTFMKSNWRRVAALGTLPWLAEVVTAALCVHLYLGFPLIWGFLLGSVYASLSCIVVMPTMVRITNSAGCQRNWTQLVCTAGGVDTALSVGVYGIISTFMFYDTTNESYRYSKAVLTLFVGVVIGVIMGVCAGKIPHSLDFYVTELRIAIVVIGGLAINAFTFGHGWGGTGGVAVLVCNAVAATIWEKEGWKPNNNPAFTAYKVMWSALEPMLFAYSGTFFEINESMVRVLVPGLCILATCLFVRLLVAVFACWGFTMREKIFVCCAWTPKAIVESVLCPLAINNLVALGKYDSAEMQYAIDIMRLLIQAIIITTPLGFLVTKYLGPRLFKEKTKDCEETIHESQTEMWKSQTKL